MSEQLLKRRIENLERARPLCPDCRDKCKGIGCLRCRIQSLEAFVNKVIESDCDDRLKEQAHRLLNRLI